MAPVILVLHWLVKVGTMLLTNKAVDQVIVTALHTRAKKTPGSVDDAVVVGVAAALGVPLPPALAPKETALPTDTNS